MGDDISENGEGEKLHHREVPEIVSNRGGPPLMKAGVIGALSFWIFDKITTGSGELYVVGFISAAICWFAYYRGKEEEELQQWLQQNEEHAQLLAEYEGETMRKSADELSGVMKGMALLFLIIFLIIFVIRQ